jgi:hypothetical protein
MSKHSLMRTQEEELEKIMAEKMCSEQIDVMLRTAGVFSVGIMDVCFKNAQNAFQTLSDANGRRHFTSCTYTSFEVRTICMTRGSDEKWSLSKKGLPDNHARHVTETIRMMVYSAGGPEGVFVSKPIAIVNPVDSIVLSFRVGPLTREAYDRQQQRLTQSKKLL